MLARLKKACTNCRPSSIRTYWVNIRGLAKLAGKESVPANGRWLDNNLLERVRAMPLSRAKRLAQAGVKAAQMYGIKKPAWSEAMTIATDRYARQRESGKRTKREHENWPQGGYKALGTLATSLHQDVKHLESKTQWNHRDLYHYQKFLIVLFYSKFALRGDLADVRYKQPLGPNFIKPVGKGFKVQIGQHKTSRAHGAIELDIDAKGPVAAALHHFLPQARRLKKHGFLLSTLRTGGPLKRPDMLKLIRTVTRERLGKNIGVQLIRVLKVSQHQAEIDKAKALQLELGHSGAMQRRYISRKD